jgi:hypothetical protein
LGLGLGIWAEREECTITVGLFGVGVWGETWRFQRFDSLRGPWARRVKDLSGFCH